MAVRTAYVPVAGSAITAANHAKFPGGWIGYVETTSAQTGITSDTDLTGLTVTVTVGTSRRVHITGFVRMTQVTTGGVSALHIADGSSTNIASSNWSVAVNGWFTPVVHNVRAPSSGSNTWKLRAGTSAGSISTLADAACPAFIMVTDVGPSA